MPFACDRPLGSNHPLRSIVLSAPYMSSSKRQRQAEKEAAAIRARDAARDLLKKKGISYESTLSARSSADFKRSMAKRDNTLELVKKRRREADVQSVQDMTAKVSPAANYPASSSLRQFVRTVYVGQPTQFGIPVADKKKSTLPPDWVLVKQEMVGDYYFWNRKTNVTTREKPTEVSGTGCPQGEVEGPIEEGEEDIYQAYDASSERIYFWNSSTWRTGWDKAEAKLIPPEVGEADREAANGGNVKEVVDGISYNQEDWETARDDALAKRRRS